VRPIARPGSCDQFDARYVLGTVGLLADFNRAGLLIASDVHVARRLGAILDETDEVVLLAAAFAVRAPRIGHVCVDLATLADTVAIDSDIPVDLARLAWPDPAAWAQRIAASVLVAVGDDGPGDRPLRLVGSRLYLDRYWGDEVQVAAEIRARADVEIEGIDQSVLEDGCERLFADDVDGLQRRAGERAVTRRLVVISGGPGTGKTTTVAKILALIGEQARAAGTRWPLMALCAPTGKAADRLQEATADQLVHLDVDDDVRSHVSSTPSFTLHRLLGARGDTGPRFAHDRANPLPYDVVVVDEASMVSLSMMARLLEAARPEARVIFVGDAGQLASVEAGAVLGDLVGPAIDDPDRPPLGKNIVVLQTVHRYGEDIGALANAVRRGDDGAVMSALRAGSAAVRWIAPDEGRGSLALVRTAAVATGRAVALAAHAGRPAEALTALGAFRVVCAHRRGDQGVARWIHAIERWLGEDVDGFAAGPEWYVGRPVMMTRNDYSIGLFNGDIGVVVAGSDGRSMVAFARGAEVIQLSPFRLGEVETVHAMTIHKSQGSQFATAVVVVPEASSRMLTRELLYTGITRARSSVILVGSEAAIRAAVRRPIARASGLRQRVWG
jgi:exodeoxyribonuclease V alpha subunit